MKGKFLCMALLVPAALWAQLHIVVQSIPSNTPSGDTLYVAGSFNNWNPQDPATILQGSNPWTATLPPGSGTVQFKFTRGSWGTVEGNASGGFLPNRSYTYGNGDTLLLSIASWEDLGGGNSTAQPNVGVVSTSFPMPQLNRTRTIRICLPPGYDTSQASYPVLYMHDGQNLFDQATAFAGEWEVDESVNALAAQGWQRAIVVGIDNGGSQRIEEYTPWKHPSYGGGRGEDYTDFLVNTLKPYIDSAYRTIPDAQHTAIGGSSLGGLISLYAAVEFPQVFSKALVFSPSLWFSDSVWTFLQNAVPQANSRLYFLSGGQEGGGSVAVNCDSAVALLSQTGWNVAGLHHRTVAQGTHSEWFWAQEFPSGFQYLFWGPLGVEEAQVEDTL